MATAFNVKFRAASFRPRAATALLAWLLSSAALVPSAAFAEGGHHGHGEASIAVLFPFYASFAVFSCLIYFLLRNPVKKAFADRREKTSHDILVAEREFSAASKAYEEVTRLFETLHVQVDALKNDLEEETQLEVERIITTAKQRAEGLHGDALRSLAAERGRAEMTLRQQLVEEVVAVARRKLEGALGPEVDRALRQRLLQHVEGILQ